MLRSFFAKLAEKDKFIVPVYKANPVAVGGFSSTEQVDRLVFDSKEQFIEHCRTHAVPDGGYYEMVLATSNDFSNMDVSGVDWRRINLMAGKMNNTKLDGADLSGGTLDACQLEGTKLDNVRLKGTRMWGCTYALEDDSKLTAHKAGAICDPSEVADHYERSGKFEEASARHAAHVKKLYRHVKKP